MAPSGATLVGSFKEINGKVTGVKFFDVRASAKSLRFSFELPKAVNNPSLDHHFELPSFKNLSNFAARAFTWLGALAIVFLTQLILISQVHYASAQFKATETLRYELANGTAPVGQVDSNGALIAAGTPVAFLVIEKLGLQEVVLEGTSSNITTDGPGHRRDTVLPGQAGISVIFGRQASYGGVFANISKLEVGDKITTVTGQGESSYTVSKIRVAGDEATNALGNSKGRLTLVTTSGTPFLPSGVVRVEATLDGEPKVTPVRVIQNGAIPASEKALGGYMDALTPLIYLSQFLILLLVAIFWLARRWGKVQAWVAGTPILILVGSIWSGLVIQLLPNLL